MTLSVWKIIYIYICLWSIRLKVIKFKKYHIINMEYFWKSAGLHNAYPWNKVLFITSTIVHSLYWWNRQSMKSLFLRYLHIPSQISQLNILIDAYFSLLSVQWIPLHSNTIYIDFKLCELNYLVCLVWLCIIFSVLCRSICTFLGIRWNKIISLFLYWK